MKCDARCGALRCFTEWATARLDGSTHGHRIPVDLAAVLLESLDSLNIIGVELVAPERLVRKSPSTRAIVTPLPSGSQGVTGRLAAGALVAWQPTIDNTQKTLLILRSIFTFAPGSSQQRAGLQKPSE